MTVHPIFLQVVTCQRDEFALYGLFFVSTCPVGRARKTFGLRPYPLQRYGSVRESHIDLLPTCSGMETKKPKTERELLLWLLDEVNSEEDYQWVLKELSKLNALEHCGLEVSSWK